jgi:adenylate cyclase
MENLALPGGTMPPRGARPVRDRMSITFEDLGEHEVKNIARPVRAFRIVLDQPAARLRAPPAAAAAPPEGSGRRAPVPELGGDAETEFFLDSVAEDLITELARARCFCRGSQHQLHLQGQKGRCEAARQGTRRSLRGRG